MRGAKKTWVALIFFVWMVGHPRLPKRRYIPRIGRKWWMFEEKCGKNWDKGKWWNLSILICSMDSVALPKCFFCLIDSGTQKTTFLQSCGLKHSSHLAFPLLPFAMRQPFHVFFGEKSPSRLQKSRHFQVNQLADYIDLKFVSKDGGKTWPLLSQKSSRKRAGVIYVFLEKKIPVVFFFPETHGLLLRSERLKRFFQNSQRSVTPGWWKEVWEKLFRTAEGGSDWQ